MSTLESFLTPEFIRAFAWTLLHSLWQGGLLALLAAGCMLLLRKNRPAVRYLMLCLFMVLLPVLFLVTFFIIYNPGGNIHPQAIQTPNAYFSASGNLAYEPSGPEAIVSSGNWYDDPVRFFENQANWLVLIWFAGFIVFLIRFSGSLLYVYRLKNYRVYDVDHNWNGQLKRLSGRIGLKKPVRLAESAMARIPITIGYLKPVILLPLGTLSGVPPQQIEAILLHELAHILRKDYLINIIQSFIELIFFYHPVTWWLSGLIRQEREHICDDLVVGVNHDHVNYIKALTIMEELNSKSPLLASAINGSKKKLLFRVKRLLNPVRLRKGIGEGTIAFVLLISLIFIVSLNALSVIPSAYDLTGRESGEKIYNFIPYNPPAGSSVNAESKPNDPGFISPILPAIPDTIISTSKSGKVIVKVITDSTGTDLEKEIEVFVTEPEHQEYRWDSRHDRMDDRVIIMNKRINDLDSLSTIMVIKTGDSIKVIQGDTTLLLPEGYDTSFSTRGGLQFYGFNMPDMPGLPELNDFQEMPDLEYFYFDDGQLKQAQEYDRAIKDYERGLRDFDRQQRLLERGMVNPDPNPHVFINPPDAPEEFQWIPEEPDPPVRNAERIIRQELRDDGLTIRGRQYVIEIDPKAMYINGEKQPKEVYRKYKKLAESLESTTFEEGETYKLIF
jgi:beta-lactamase regulating signal transducer with metallopeptidase domain